MNVDSIKNGIVIDHIKAGKGMKIYKFLDLGNAECPVALIQNASSIALKRKDIIKIDSDFEIDTDVLGYIDPGITVNVIKDNKIIKKCHPELPETITNIIKCKNPRCITSCEQEINHIFKLADKKSGTYRCIYCETAAENNF